MAGYLATYEQPKNNLSRLPHWRKKPRKQSSKMFPQKNKTKILLLQLRMRHIYLLLIAGFSLSPSLLQRMRLSDQVFFLKKINKIKSLDHKVKGKRGPLSSAYARRRGFPLRALPLPTSHFFAFPTPRLVFQCGRLAEPANPPSSAPLYGTGWSSNVPDYNAALLVTLSVRLLCVPLSSRPPCCSSFTL